jgi:DNA-binding CsgD family transcriptional regulator
MAQWHFCHVAVHYAVARPENLAGLILVGCSVEASAWPSGIYRLLPDENWDAFVISQLARNFLPQEAVASFARIQTTITKEDFLQRQRAFDDSDIAIELTKVTTPTLLIHPKDFVILRHEESIRSAAAMPNSRLVMTEGGALPGDSVTGLAAIDDFIAGLAPVGQTPASELNVLSQREVEVLRLLAGGRSNQQIADELVISINTVRRHVSNVFDKIGAENRAQAAVYARDHGLA